MKIIFSKKQKQSSRKIMMEKKRGFDNTTPLRIDNFSSSPIIENFFLAMMSALFFTKNKNFLRKR